MSIYPPQLPPGGSFGARTAAAQGLPFTSGANPAGTLGARIAASSTPFNILPAHLRIPQVGIAQPLNMTPPLAPGTAIRPPGFYATGPTNPNPMPRMKLNPLSTTARSATSSSPLLGRGLRSGFLRGAGIGLASELGGKFVGDLIGGEGEDTPGFDRKDVGQATTGAARGAGLGYMVGGGYGAAGGALLGGLAGAFDVFGDSGPLAAVGDFFGGGGEEAPKIDVKSADTLLSQTLRKTSLSNDMRDAIKSGTLAQLELAETEEQKAAILNSAGAQIQQAEMQAVMEQEQLARSLALQAQATQIFQPFAEANQRTAALAGSLYEDIAASSPQLEDIANMFALNAQQQADAMTQNLYTTALARPRIDAMVAQQQQIDSVAAQIVQQATASAVSGQLGGGGIDVASLLASVS